jgi:hypothetical protein
MWFIPSVGLLLLALAALTYFFRRRSAARQRVSTKWPTCEGTVTSASVYHWQHRTLELYIPRVHYAYDVGGEDHTGKRLAWGQNPFGSTKEEDAEDIIARYPVGSKVLVYYNPRKTSESVLEPAETSGISTMSASMILMGLFGVVWAIIGFSLREYW